MNNNQRKETEGKHAQPISTTQEAHLVPPKIRKSLKSHVKTACCSTLRKTLQKVKQEKEKEIEALILSAAEDEFKVTEILGKGRSVITTKSIKKGEFVMEYHGELIGGGEARRREVRYAREHDTGCYMYYFNYNNKQYCIDATEENPRLGRLINHSKKGNLKSKIFLVNSIPHLIFIAERDINKDEELLYDYGDRSKRSVQDHPWLAS